jgi:ketosteroid isomerase-like protein
MKALKLIAMCTLLGWTLPAFADDKDKAATEKAAARKVLDDQAEAWNKGDLKAFMAGYWESPELSFYSGKDKTRGWKETMERYRKRYQADGKEMGKVTFSELDLQMLGPEAIFARGRWKVEAGKETHQGLFTLVMRKFPEGWRIVHDHTSGE